VTKHFLPGLWMASWTGSFFGGQYGVWCDVLSSCLGVFVFGDFFLFYLFVMLFVGLGCVVLLFYKSAMGLGTWSH